jgi:hypothetical protein
MCCCWDENWPRCAGAREGLQISIEDDGKHPEGGAMRLDLPHRSASVQTPTWLRLFLSECFWRASTNSLAAVFGGLGEGSRSHPSALLKDRLFNWRYTQAVKISK